MENPKSTVKRSAIGGGQRTEEIYVNSSFENCTKNVSWRKELFTEGKFSCSTRVV